MSDLWQGIAWGAGLSVPIGVAVNLLSPALSRGIDRRTKTAAGRRAQRNADFRRRAEHLAKDRNALYIELLEVLLRVAFFTAVFGVASGAVVIFAQAFPGAAFSTILYVLAQALALLGTLIVLNVVRPAIVLVREVRSVHEGD